MCGDSSGGEAYREKKTSSTFHAGMKIRKFSQLLWILFQKARISVANTLSIFASSFQGVCLPTDVVTENLVACHCDTGFRYHPKHRSPLRSSRGLPDDDGSLQY